jgi:hypothetical protein
MDGDDDDEDRVGRGSDDDAEGGWGWRKKLGWEGFVAAWILCGPTWARVDAVTRSGGAVGAVNTLTGGVGKLSVGELGEYYWAEAV